MYVDHPADIMQLGDKNQPTFFWNPFRTLQLPVHVLLC